jgi:hypothetical protein
MVFKIDSFAQTLLKPDENPMVRMIPSRPDSLRYRYDIVFITSGHTLD